MDSNSIKSILIGDIRRFILSKGRTYRLTRDDIAARVDDVVSEYNCTEIREELVESSLLRFQRELVRDFVEIKIHAVGNGSEAWCKIDRLLLPRYNKYLNDVASRIGIEASNKIEVSVDKIFNQIYFENKTPKSRKGLVLGHVQSGKTANYIGLAAKAIDVGYKVVIILTSNNTALREQTQRRVNRDLIGSTSLFPNDKVVNWDEVQEELENYLCPIDSEHPGFAKMLPKSLTSRVDFKPDDQEDGLIQLSKRNNALFLIVKKHATRQNGFGVLNKLNDWLQNDADDSGKLPLRCLIIDDECDSSTPNNIRRVQNEGDVSSVHGEVFRLFSMFEQCSYVGYTATPFANVFMDRDARTSLYPSDFIISLPKPASYMGDEEFFSGRYTNVYQGVARSDLNNFCDLAAPMPDSIKIAIKQFIARRVEVIARVSDKTFNDLEKDPWSSMIIHVSRKIFDQSVIYQKVRDYIKRINKDEIWFEHLEIENRRAIKRNEFDLIYDECIESLQLLEINGNGDSLDYGNNDYPFLICVGGDIISRGLTIEGLTTSYYLRDSSNYDSLLQMGRWFGYRKGYDDLIRLHTTKDIFEKFKFLVEVNSQLRDVIESYSLDSTKTPNDIAPAILAHESMMPTGRMGAALDVSKINGMLYQTLYFGDEANENNLSLTNNLVLANRLKVSTPKCESIKVSGQKINEYIKSYKFSGLRNKAVSDNIKVVQEKVLEFEGILWDVAIHSLKGPSTYQLGEVDIKPVKRSLKRDDMDFKAKVITDPMQTHSQNEGVPRLVIYYIDTAEIKEFNSDVLIGFSIRFPEVRGGNTYYQQIFSNGNNQ